MKVRPQEFESRTPAFVSRHRTCARGMRDELEAPDEGQRYLRGLGMRETEVGHEARRASRTDADAGRRMEQARLARIPEAPRRGHGRVLAGTAGPDSRAAQP